MNGSGSFFSGEKDKIRALVQKVAGVNFRNTWSQLAEDIDAYGQPAALLFGMRNFDGNYVGFSHIRLSYQWSDNGFHQSLLVTATLNYSFIGSQYRPHEDGVHMAHLTGALAARQLAPETLYQSAPSAESVAGYAADFPFRRLSTRCRTRVIPSGGAESLNKFQQAFEKNIHDVTRKHPYMYWFNAGAAATEDEFDCDNPDLWLTPDEDDEADPWWELH